MHRDGYGRGLVGLDPRGELGDFMLWSGLDPNRLNDPNRGIAPELQIEFLALRLHEWQKDKGGDLWHAVAAWHTGGDRDADYVDRVRTRMGEWQANV